MNNKRNGTLGIGIAFIVAGLLLVAYRFGYIDLGIFWSFLTLWPLLLIVIGVSIIFRNRPWVKALAWILLIATVILYSHYFDKNVRFFGRDMVRYDLVSSEVAIDHNANIKTGSAIIMLGAGKLEIESSDDYEVKATFPEEITTFRSKVSDNEAFEFSAIHDDDFLRNSRWLAHGYDYSFELNEVILLNIDVDMGAMDSDLDLRDIEFDRLDIDMGAGDIDLYLGYLENNARISIDSGVSDIKIYIPEDIPAQIIFDGGIKDINFDSDSTFIKTGDNYETREFDKSENYYIIDISTGVGELNIEQY